MFVGQQRFLRRPLKLGEVCSQFQRSATLWGLRTLLISQGKRFEQRLIYREGTMRSHFLISWREMPIINEFANEFLRLKNSQCWKEAKRRKKRKKAVYNPP